MPGTSGAATARQLLLAAMAALTICMIPRLCGAAQSDVLTGGSEREWILTRVEMVMGSSTACTKGERYFFRSGGAVRIERCTDGKLQRLEQRWSLGREQGTLYLTIGPRRYEVLFIDKPGKTVLRLRNRSTNQSVPTEDRFLTYEAD
jgi:hypothetical protein